MAKYDELIERLASPTYWKSSDGYTEAFDSAPERAATALTDLQAQVAAGERLAEALGEIEKLFGRTPKAPSLDARDMTRIARQALTKLEELLNG